MAKKQKPAEKPTEENRKGKPSEPEEITVVGRPNKQPCRSQ